MINGYCVIFLLKPAMSVILNSKNLKHSSQNTYSILKKGTSRQRSGKGTIRKISHSKNPKWEKTKLTIRYLYHENIS